MRLSFSTPLSILAMTLVSLTVVACSNAPDVSQAIGKRIEERRSDTIRLADATSFAWDQVYLFGPYTPRQDVCSTLRIQASDCERLVSFESSDDGEMSLAFLARGELVHFTRHVRSNGDFTPVPAEQPLSRDQAVFRVLPGARLVLER